MVRMVSIVAMAALAACSVEPDSLREAAVASHEEAELSTARPILNVADLQASFRYYRDELGFRVDWEHGEPADFGSVSRGETILFLCEGCQGTPGGWLMVFARDVNALYDEYASTDARIRMPPKDMPWGIREMHVSDLDGNVIRFGTGEE
ncbi:MAG: glyoxalase superfamily protein [Nannocystaceae bacterium]|nr:glyoxalase superfamily protein [bacterium]